ncbi:unnamed protein product [Effrenium voratum]|nr:unnamed protein product [Effrenium voratum]
MNPQAVGPKVSACCDKSMACCRASPTGHARSSITRMDDVLVMHFPMYTVPLETLLAMTRVEPHEELKARNALAEFQSGMGKAAFVSHQWVATDHPDPECKQLRVLQQSLKRIMGKMRFIPLDAASEVLNSNAKPLATSKLLAEPLFFWYDYFSCPQKGRQLQDAVSSIHAYVDQCSFFFALVPVLQNLDSTDLLTQKSWHSRGWCRLERTCRELSEEQSWIMVKSPGEIELIASATASMRAGSGPVAEGNFTVPEDSLRLGPVLRTAVRRKMRSLLKDQDWPGFRALLNQQAVMLRGYDCDVFVPEMPEEDQSDHVPRVMKFFHQNRFRSIRETDRCGWLPLHYAALNGDASLVHDLLALQSDPNQGTKRFHKDLGIEQGASSLVISCTFKNNDVVRVLIAAKARVNCSTFASQPLDMAAVANNHEAVQLLCSAGCSLLQRNVFGLLAIQNAAAYSAVEVVDMLVEQGCVTALDLNRALHAACDAKVVRRLVELRADVNTRDQCLSLTPISKVFVTAKTLQHRFKVTQLTKMMYHGHGASPLITALLLGQYEAAAALIAEGARLHTPNSRGMTAADFIAGNPVPEFLKEALDGKLEACQRVSLLARGWVELRF